MGRYYNGDIEGKFWFAVQSSEDPSNFGGKETPICFDDSDEVAAISYSFTKTDLPKINSTIDQCVVGLGDNKEKLDEFFSANDYYNEGKLVEYLEMDKVPDDPAIPILLRALLVLYARLDLGEKIKACVEKTGQCNFDAEL